MTFGASLKTPGGARRTQANAQPRAHTVGGASPRSRGSRLSTGALPALSPRGRERSARGLDFGPSLRSREGGFDDVDLGGSMRVSSLSHSFDAGGVGGVVNHFPGQGCSRRSSGIGSPSGSPNASSGSVSDGDEESATAVVAHPARGATPQPPPWAHQQAVRGRPFRKPFRSGFRRRRHAQHACSELGLSNSSLDRFVGGGNAPPPRLVVPGGPEDDDAVVVTVEPPTRSIASPMHPHGFGGYDDDFQLAADLNSPSAGLDGRPGRRTYGGRGRGARGGRGSVERTIQTPSKLHGAPRAARGGEADGVEKEGEDGGKGVYMDGEGPGANAARGHPSTAVIRASRAASEVGDEDPAEGGADLNDDDDDRGIEPIAETLEPTATPTASRTTPTDRLPPATATTTTGWALSSDDESVSFGDAGEPDHRGVGHAVARGHSRGADSSTSGDGGGGGSAGLGLVLPARDGFVVDLGKTNQQPGFSRPRVCARSPPTSSCPGASGGARCPRRWVPTT